jgi:hypothetical protein
MGVMESSGVRHSRVMYRRHRSNDGDDGDDDCGNRDASDRWCSSSVRMMICALWIPWKMHTSLSSHTRRGAATSAAADAEADAAMEAEEKEAVASSSTWEDSEGWMKACGLRQIRYDP